MSFGLPKSITCNSIGIGWCNLWWIWSLSWGRTWRASTCVWATNCVTLKAFWLIIWSIHCLAYTPLRYLITQWNGVTKSIHCVIKTRRETFASKWCILILKVGLYGVAYSNIQSRNFFYGYDRLFSCIQLPENYFFRHCYPTRGRLKQNRCQLPLQPEDARQNTLVMTSQDYFGL